jgi:WD40 repeat protein
MHKFCNNSLSSSPLQLLESSHQQSITSVLYNLGMVVTASKDGQVLLHSPGGSHDLLCTLEQRTSAPTGLDFSRNTLAVAGGDRNVSLWTHTVTGSIA